MENNIAYLITGKHFEVEEVDFEQLKKYTNNVILQYEKDFTKFRRALFELDRLGFNIGIYSSEYTGLFLLPLIAGFNIKLGIWFKYAVSINIEELSVFNKIYFITGLVSEIFDIPKYPRWGTHGDIEYYEKIKLDFIREPIKTLKLNTDFVKIYDENNLKPVLSTYK